ncbi:hypothetical protein EJB05_16979, partial [Eragrostis curvula]
MLVSPVQSSNNSSPPWQRGPTNTWAAPRGEGSICEMDQRHGGSGLTEGIVLICTGLWVILRETVGVNESNTSLMTRARTKGSTADICWRRRVTYQQSFLDVIASLNVDLKKEGPSMATYKAGTVVV